MPSNKKITKRHRSKTQYCKTKKIEITKRPRSKTQTYKFNKVEIQQALKKEAIQKEGLNACQIQCFLANSPNFLGCFAQDQLSTLNIRSLPVFLIVNFDHSYSSGTHWIALKIDKRSIEIFDPLGFNSLRWPNVPHFLLDFLHKFSLNRQILLSKEIQPFNSTLCGFYCIFFVLYRVFHSFRACNKLFSAKLYKNDQILSDIFNKL